MDLVISRGYFFFFSFFSLHGSLALTLRDCENDWKNICLFIGDASMLFNRRFVNLFRLIALPPVWILMALPLLYFQFEAVGKLISLPISHRSCFIIFLLLFFPFFFFLELLLDLLERGFLYLEREFKSQSVEQFSENTFELSIPKKKLIVPLLNYRNDYLIVSSDRKFK